MIHRSGPNVRYTHDAQAALVDLRRALEFGHVPDVDLAAMIAGREPFAPDYCIDLESGHAWRRGAHYMEDARIRAGDLVVVPLYHFRYLYEEAREDFGFSCMICRHPQAFAQRGRLVPWQAEFMVSKRQAAIGPALACDVCAGLIWLVLSGDGLFTNEKQGRFAERRIRDYCDRLRSAPAGLARPLSSAEAGSLLVAAGMAPEIMIVIDQDDEIGRNEVDRNDDAIGVPAGADH